jgi:Ca2+-binding RTX toxin-like protein
MRALFRQKAVVPLQMVTHKRVRFFMKVIPMASFQAVAETTEPLVLATIPTVIAETRLATLRALEGAFDLSALAGLVTLDTTAIDNAAIGGRTTVTGTRITFGGENGTDALVISGSGFGPSTSWQALAQALEAGTATGTMSRIALVSGGATLFAVDYRPGGIDITLGDVILALETTLPASLQGGLQVFFAATDLLFAADTLSPEALAEAAAFLAPYVLTNLAIAQAGTTLLELALALDGLRLSAGGLVLDLAADMPANLGEGIALLAGLAVGDLSALAGIDIRAGMLTVDALPGGSITLTGDIAAALQTLLTDTGEARDIFRVDGVDYADALLDLFADGSSGDLWESMSNENGIALGYAGRDTIFGRGGDDFIDGGADADALYGNRGDDTVIGGQGADTLLGGDGDDRVIGGNGRDLAYLGNDDDTFIDNGQAGANGRDTVFGGKGNDTVQGGNGDDVFYGEAGFDVIYGRLGNDRVHGGDKRDILYGGDGNDTVFGGDGRDRAFLGHGDDVFVDNAEVTFGDDLIFGAGGDDTIQMGGGNDTATGGAGQDVFVFAAEINADVIRDYEVGVDALKIAQALWGDNLLESTRLDAISSVVDDKLVLDFGGGNTITFEGLTSTAGLFEDIALV